MTQSDSDDGPVTMKVSYEKPTELGDEELDVTMTAPESGYMNDEFLLVRSGDVIIAVSQNSVNTTPVDLSAVAKAYVESL